jgi:maltose alpha-D-glucosyltransferase / alpha-amylase
MDAVIYEVHVKAFYDSAGDGIGDFKGLTSKLDYLKELGITAIWLLPFYPSPLKDDGYDISDYLDVNQAYGALQDFQEFLRQSHNRGIKVITELVLNHTSDQHPWFQASRRAEAGSDARNFYVWSPTSNKYKEARVIFNDFESSNWTWDTTAQAYYWHRFYSHQPDLNFDNPHTQEVMLDVVAYWLKMGVDGLRLDAVPYLFEREGTNCENLPESHEFLKKLRAYIDAHFKGKMLLGEANQWPTEAAAYFGTGDECHMAFHFPLMPRMFMAIQMEDRFPIIDILDQTPPIPENCHWALFLRNHDELTLEMVTDEERDYMYRVYGKDKQARINLGIRRRLAPLLDNDRRKIELMSILLFTLPGTPVIYYGDEIGMGDNYYLGDRNGVRTPMQWSADLNAGFSKTNPQKLYLPVIIEPKYHYEAVNVENQENDPASLLTWMKRLISIKKHYKALRRGTIEFLFPDNWKIIAFIRKYEDQLLLVAANLSKHPQAADIDLSGFEGYIPHEVFGGIAFPTVGKSSYRLTFSSHGYYVFSLAKRPDTENRAARSIPEITLAKSTQDLFRGKWKDRLEELILPSFLNGARWFEGKARIIEMVRVRDVLPFEPTQGPAVPYYLVMVEVRYTEGLSEEYFIPLAFTPAEKSTEIIEKNPGAVVTWVSMDDNQRGIIFDAMQDPGFREELLRAIARGREIRGEQGELTGSPKPALSSSMQSVKPEGLASHIVGAEQSNTSAVFEDRFILKIFRRMESGVNPELEIGDVLTKQSFASSPALLGDLRYTRFDSEPITLAVLEAFVKNEGDAWALFTIEFASFLERVASLKKEALGALSTTGSIWQLLDSGISEQFAELMGQAFLQRVALLGKRTAEFHLALAREVENPSFAPEAFTRFYQVALFQSMTSYANRILHLLSGHVAANTREKAAAAQVLSSQDLITASFSKLRLKSIDALKTRTHGDYHLGQVLYTGKDFEIIDFEGEPARSITDRRLKRSPMRDVAGMIRSFHYCAQSNLPKQAPSPSPLNISNPEAWANEWYESVSAVFLKSYLETMAGTHILPNDREALTTLLDAYLLEKAVYELGYELNNRPAMVIIPLKGILDILGLPDDTESPRQRSGQPA